MAILLKGDKIQFSWKKFALKWLVFLKKQTGSFWGKKYFKSHKKTILLFSFYLFTSSCIVSVKATAGLSCSLTGGIYLSAGWITSPMARAFSMLHYHAAGQDGPNRCSKQLGILTSLGDLGNKAQATHTGAQITKPWYPLLYVSSFLPCSLGIHAHSLCVVYLAQIPVFGPATSCNPKCKS